MTPGPIAVSVTARDLAAPLGIILGRSTERVARGFGHLEVAPARVALSSTGAARRRGDVDGDGRVTVADAARLQALGGAGAADVSGDGSVDGHDARLLLGWLAGLVEGEDAR